MTVITVKAIRHYGVNATTTTTATITSTNKNFNEMKNGYAHAF